MEASKCQEKTVIRIPSQKNEVKSDMTSVIYVDLSSDSEDEGPSNAKRSRKEQSKVTTSKTLSSRHLDASKTAVSQLPAGIKTSVATGDELVSGMVVGAYKSMHIPSGITVTKYNNNSYFNGCIKNASPILIVDNNKNNNTNSMKNKSVNSTAAQITNVYSKALTTMATITSVPIPHPCKFTPSKAWQKKSAQSVQQQKSQVIITTPGTQQKSLTPTKQNTLVVAQQKSTQIQQQQQSKMTTSSTLTLPLQKQQHQQKGMLAFTHQKKTPSHTLTQKKTMMNMMQNPIPPTQVQQQQQEVSLLMSITPKLSLKQTSQQLLPIVQKQPLTLTSTSMLPTISTLTLLKENHAVKPLGATIFSVRKMKHQHKQQQEGLSESPLTGTFSISCSNDSISSPLIVKQTTTPTTISSNEKLQTRSTGGVSCDSAARTLPYKTNAPTRTTTATNMRIVQPFPSSSSITAGKIQSTPPLRLLASPPHLNGTVNQPLLLNLPATTSITPQLTPTTTPPPTLAPALVTAVAGVKLQEIPAALISPVKRTLSKRVHPITILQKSDDEWRNHMAQQQHLQLQQRQNLKNAENTPTIVLVESPPTTPPTENMELDNTKRRTPPTASISSASAVFSPSTTIIAHASVARAPLVSEYATLLKLCREQDRSKDMQRLIDNKLIKYYYSVHESFVRSRGFRKQLLQAMDRIRSEPDMIYVHLKSVVDELKVRRKSKVVQLSQEAQPNETLAKDNTDVVAPVDALESRSQKAPTSENQRSDERIRKLNRTLYTITKRISTLEEADVDWNDDDSSYLQVERYKKRACQIYEKICDLTGESKSAHRLMKQPILFKDSPYPQFNRTLSAFVNRMHEFPDYHDVLKLLEHCNKEKGLGLALFEMKRIAHDAFVKVGRLLQTRRKTDLYETVTHFTANAKDPAASDATLLAKLNENSKKQTKISDILEKFAREQDLTAEEQREARQKVKQLQTELTSLPKLEGSVAVLVNGDENPCTSAQAAQQLIVTSYNAFNSAKTHRESDNENDSGSERYEEDENDDESDEDVDIFVDNFKANGEVSDADSDIEINTALDATAHVIVNNETRAKTAVPKANIEIHEDCVSNESFFQKLPLSKLSDVPAAHALKIMSVSSLNASVSETNDENNTANNNINCNETLQQQHQKRQKQKLALDTEIIISDEES